MQTWKEKRKTIRHYNQQASIYDLQYLEEQNLKNENILKNLNVNPNDLLLDLVCGTGFLFPYIRNPKILIGIDVSRNSLIHAKKRIQKMKNIELVCADADYTPFPNQIFDKIFAITIFQNIPKPRKTIQEMKRIGKSQAIFAITGLKKKYTKQNFVNLLEKKKLQIIKLINNEKIKGYLALCINI